MMTQVGSCSKCGAPVYGPAAWMGITPPPSTPSCSCSTGAIITTITSEPRTLPDNIWRDFGKELDALKAENELLRQQLNELRTEAPKQQPNPIEADAELMEALAEFDSDLVLNGSQESAKKELIGLLDDLEVMIESLNTGTGMGLRVPEKLNEIRNSLNT